MEKKYVWLQNVCNIQKITDIDTVERSDYVTEIYTISENEMQMK
jgi:hypothetical protein